MFGNLTDALTYATLRKATTRVQQSTTVNGINNTRDAYDKCGRNVSTNAPSNFSRLGSKYGLGKWFWRQLASCHGSKPDFARCLRHEVSDPNSGSTLDPSSGLNLRPEERLDLLLAQQRIDRAMTANLSLIHI